MNMGYEYFYGQQAADAKTESEKLAEELKEIQEAKCSETGGAEADPETLADSVVAKETGKSKIILVVILLATLAGCGFWLV